MELFLYTRIKRGANTHKIKKKEFSIINLIHQYPFLCKEINTFFITESQYSNQIPKEQHIINILQLNYFA